MIRSGLKIIPTDRRYDPLPGCCFNCWVHGHTARECPRASQGSFCRNCGRDKTTIDDCPRCSEAHWAYRQQRYQGHGDIRTKVIAYQKPAPQAIEDRLTVTVQELEAEDSWKTKPTVAQPEPTVARVEGDFMKMCLELSAKISHLPPELQAEIFKEALNEQRQKRQRK